jgi:hypothetical protein
VHSRKSFDDINCRAKLGRGLLSGVYSKPPPEGADEKGLVSNNIMIIVESIFHLFFLGILFSAPSIDIQMIHSILLLNGGNTVSTMDTNFL